jgi:hypothetical protein
MKITLCGSLKFEQQFHEWNKKLTLAGHVVYSVAVFPSYAGSKSWYTEEEKIGLDLIHLLKISNSDAIFVINVGHYIGESTTREIEWAHLNEKLVFLLTSWRNGDLKVYEPDTMEEETVV